MKRAFAMTALVSAAALGLAACDSEDVENTPIDDIDEVVDEDVNDEGYPLADTLSEEQQLNYDAMDRQAVSDEYDTNRAEMETGDVAAEGPTPSDEPSNNAAISGSGSASDENTSTSQRATSAPSRSMPARSQMSFSYLDRNDDGRLSVAEYAIWALPTNPNPPEPNDALGPHLTQDEINQAGQTFFYFDDDGDTYLSQEEFQDARNSSRIG